MLNKIQKPNEYCIYPWIDRICNVVKQNDILVSMKCPDVAAVDVLSSSTFYSDFTPSNDPNALPPFSMGIGNFVELYFNKDYQCFWDAVVTCFFLDTAPVVMEYIETIHHILRPGGIWTNIGTLMSHSLYAHSFTHYIYTHAHCTLTHSPTVFAYRSTIVSLGGRRGQQQGREVQ